MNKIDPSKKRRRAAHKRGEKRTNRLRKTQKNKSIRKKRVLHQKESERKKFQEFMSSLLNK